MFGKIFRVGSPLTNILPRRGPATPRRRNSAKQFGIERLEDRRVLSAATLINEIDVNPPGRSDNRYMYVELEGTPGASLNNMYFVAFQSGGNAELVENLSGYSIGADGLAVIKNSTGGFSIPAATTLIPDNTFFTSDGYSGFTQDTLSFYLFSSPTPFVEGTDYDSNNDGTLDHLPAGATALDHVAVIDGSTTLTYGGVVIQDLDGGGAPDAVTRFFGNTTTTTAAWFGGELVDTGNIASTVTYDETRPGTNMPNGSFITPGSLNYPVPAGPTLTPSGNTATFTAGSAPVAIDAGITLSDPESATISSVTVTTTGFSEDAYGFATPPTMNATITQGHNGQGAVNVITLSGLDTAADYQAALRSITYQDTALSNLTQGTRTLSITVNDGVTTTSPVTELVKVTSPPPVVSTSSNTGHTFTLGGSAVAVDSGATATSYDTDLTGASMTIVNYQSGDSLNFTNQNGITGNYSAGVLTLSGSATPAQYSAALQSVTFSTTGQNTTTRTINVVALDNAASSTTSNTGVDTVNISAPVTVTGVYVSGSAWAQTFDTYLAGHTNPVTGNNYGSAAYGYALQTGSSAAQTQTLPWTNINTITVTFSGPVSGISVGSLELTGGSGGSTPSVTGFTSDGGNTYSWTLSGPLTNNRYVIGVASTDSSFGPAVVDSDGAGISGTFTTGQAFPSGNGLAGSTFDFFFDVLPGDTDRNASDNPTDINNIRPLSSGTRSTSSSYNPYYDLLGAGIINVTILNTVRPLTGRLKSTIRQPLPTHRESGRRMILSAWNSACRRPALCSKAARPLPG